MKKIIILLYSYLLISVSAYSQSFFQSAGTTASVTHATLARASTRSQGRFSMTNIHLNYFPRINFPISDYISFSLGAPVGVGATFISNSFMNVNGTYLSYDIPIVVDYNFGFKSTIDPGDDQFGYYFGLGYSMSSVLLDSISDTKFKPKSSGMILRSGFRLAFPYSDKKSGISLGLYYKFGMGEEKFQTLGANIFVDL